MRPLKESDRCERKVSRVTFKSRIWGESHLSRNAIIFGLISPAIALISPILFWILKQYKHFLISSPNLRRLCCFTVFNGEQTKLNEQKAESIDVSYKTGMISVTVGFMDLVRFLLLSPVQPVNMTATPTLLTSCVLFGFPCKWPRSSFKLRYPRPRILQPNCTDFSKFNVQSLDWFLEFPHSDFLSLTLNVCCNSSSLIPIVVLQWIVLSVTIFGSFSKQQSSARSESTPKLCGFVPSPFLSIPTKNSPNFHKVGIDYLDTLNSSKKLPTKTKVIYYHRLCPN